MRERVLLPQQRVIDDQITASNWSLTKQKFARVPADDRNKIALCQQSEFILLFKEFQHQTRDCGELLEMRSLLNTSR